MVEIRPEWLHQPGSRGPGGSSGTGDSQSCGFIPQLLHSSFLLRLISVRERRLPRHPAAFRRYS